MELKKIYGIISNVIAVGMYMPLCTYFPFLGLMFLVYADYSLFWTIPTMCILGAGGVWLYTPAFCVVAIVLSVVFRKKNKYPISYIIQLLPFLTVLFGIFLMILSMISGNT